MTWKASNLIKMFSLTNYELCTMGSKSLSKLQFKNFKLKLTPIEENFFFNSQQFHDIKNKFLSLVLN